MDTYMEGDQVVMRAAPIEFIMQGGYYDYIDTIKGNTSITLLSVTCHVEKPILPCHVGFTTPLIIR